MSGILCNIDRYRNRAPLQARFHKDTARADTSLVAAPTTCKARHRATSKTEVKTADDATHGQNKDATQHCCSNRAQYHRGCFGGVRCCRKGAILALDARGINRERAYGATAATPNYVRSLSRGVRLLRPRFHIKHSALVVSVGR